MRIEYRHIVGLIASILYIEAAVILSIRIELPQRPVPDFKPMEIIHTPPGPYEHDCWDGKWCRWSEMV